jgi:hypothetical protein
MINWLFFEREKHKGIILQGKNSRKSRYAAKNEAVLEYHHEFESPGLVNGDKRRSSSTK